jgi:hypothetical protein
VSTSHLQDAAAAIRKALDNTPRSIEDTYAALSDLDELVIVLAAYTRRLSGSVSRLPGIVDGLRIDDMSEPVAPEQARDMAAWHLATARDRLDEAQDAIAAAYELTSRLFLDGGGNARGVRP